MKILRYVLAFSIVTALLVLGFHTNKFYANITSIITQPISESVKVGEEAEFTVSAKGTGLRYQWQFSNNGGKTWWSSTMPGSKTPSITIEGMLSRNGYLYRCVVMDSDGTTVTSNEAKLTVKESLKIAINPIDQSVEVGESAKFAVAVRGEKLSYQWEFSKDGGKSWLNSSMIGAKTSSLIVEGLGSRDGYMYRCVVTDRYGKSVTSTGARFTVKNTDDIVIKTNIENQSIQVGEIANFAFVVEGEELSYTWQFSKDNGKTWWTSTMPGSKTSNITVEGLKCRNGYMYRCIVTDNNGNRIISADAKLIVKDVGILVIKINPKSQSIQVGEVAKFAIVAEGDGLSYQWQFSNNNGEKWHNSTMPGSKTSSITVKGLLSRDGYIYRCIVTDKDGDLLISSGANFTVKDVHMYGTEMPVGKNDKGYVFKKVCQDCGEETYVYYDAIMTFVDDDAKTQAMVHWEKIIDETGITMTAAVIPGKVGDSTNYGQWWSYAGWDLINRMQEKGVDFVNHTYSHTNLTKLSEDEIHTDLQKCKEVLKAHGIQSDILVYPNNAYNDIVISVVDDYFNTAFTCKNKINVDTISRDFTLSRMNINDKNKKRVIEFDAERIVECEGIKPVETLKKELNQALDNKGWLVYMVHAYDSPSGKYYFDEESERTIIDFCKYVQSLGNVKIVSLTEGVAASAAIQE